MNVGSPPPTRPPSSLARETQRAAKDDLRRNSRPSWCRRFARHPSLFPTYLHARWESQRRVDRRATQGTVNATFPQCSAEACLRNHGVSRHPARGDRVVRPLKSILVDLRTKSWRMNGHVGAEEERNESHPRPPTKHQTGLARLLGCALWHECLPSGSCVAGGSLKSTMSRCTGRNSCWWCALGVDMKEALPWPSGPVEKGMGYGASGQF